MSVMSKYPRAAEGAESRDLGDEFLFYDRTNDRVHVLNATARDIFLLCDGARSEADVARALAQKYEIDEETARRDTRETIEQLVELGLLRT